MNLEWKMRLALRVMALSGFKPMHQSTPEEIRANEIVPQNVITRLIFGKPVDLAAVEDIQMSGRNGGIPGRVYRPSLNTPLPTIVYYHGGGWVIGNLDTHDRVCRALAQETGWMVVSVDYRLAPEHKFPAAVEDAYDALCWVADQAADLGVDTTHIAVAGDSAGGNLAAVVCHLSRDEDGPPIAKQILIYPSVDSTKSYPSAVEFANGPILTKKDMDWFRDHYLNGEQDKQDIRFSPLVGNLENLPPAFILTAEYDPLRDQGQAYAEALARCANQVEYKEYKRQVHGFLSLGGVSSQSSVALQEIGRFLK